MVNEMSEWFVRDDSAIYDLGSSTGETIALLHAKHKGKRGVRFIGVENSLPMIERARLKCPFENAQFLHQNIIEVAEFRDADLILSLYTMQFINLNDRRALLKKIYRDLRAGGGLLMAEKVRGETSLFEDIWIELYWDMKRKSGLNSDQVLHKARSLRGVLLPLTTSENVALLKEVGFRDVDVFMKWYNFSGIIAIKM
jgi:tRNA (cmo5U34)-methyltransferase